MSTPRTDAFCEAVWKLDKDTGLRANKMGFKEAVEFARTLETELAQEKLACEQWRGCAEKLIGALRPAAFATPQDALAAESALREYERLKGEGA